MLTAVTLLAISSGSVKIGIKEILKILTGYGTENQTSAPVIMNIRLPGVLAALAGGACLALSGLLLQIFFRNPIVEPYILGISSGANLFAGIVVLGGYTFGMKCVSPVFMFGGAFAGALTVTAVVVFATGKVKNIVTLLIIGLMVKLEGIG